MKVELISYTEDADDILIMTKRSRHLDECDSIESIANKSAEWKKKEIDYVFGTVGSCWEFVDYVFLIKGVTRAFTHQLVRSRHASFAQQSMRLERGAIFEYLNPVQEESSDMFNEYECVMADISSGYLKLIGAGLDPQDARGVLPTNILTNIMLKVNLRTVADMISIRSCIRTQVEYREFVSIIKDEILGVHSFIPRKIFDVYCIKNQRCPWENFHNCPIKSRYKYLGYRDEDAVADMREYYESVKNRNFQPEIKDEE